MSILNIQPTLEDELIILRPLQPSDKQQLFEAANDPLIWDQHPAKRHQKSVFDIYFEESLESRGALVVIEKTTSQIIGSSRFYEIGQKDAIEIGWTFLSRAYWGGTYNKAMKNLMISHALNDLEYVVLYIAKDNYRSQKAAEKIGAKPVSESFLPRLLSPNPNNVSYVISKASWSQH